MAANHCLAIPSRRSGCCHESFISRASHASPCTSAKSSSMTYRRPRSLQTVNSTSGEGHLNDYACVMIGQRAGQMGNYDATEHFPRNRTINLRWRPSCSVGGGGREIDGISDTVTARRCGRSLRKKASHIEAMSWLERPKREDDVSDLSDGMCFKISKKIAGRQTAQVFGHGSRGTFSAH